MRFNVDSLRRSGKNGYGSTEHHDGHLLRTKTVILFCPSLTFPYLYSFILSPKQLVLHFAFHRVTDKTVVRLQSIITS